MTRFRLHAGLAALLIAVALPHRADGRGAPIQGSAPAPAPTRAAAPPAAAPEAARRRIIAVGDLHGDLARARESLRLAGVIDASDHWAAGTATFVQIGDVMDRGDDVRAVLDLLRNLEREAAAAGGKAIMLIGNHETLQPGGGSGISVPR